MYEIGKVCHYQHLFPAAEIDPPKEQLLPCQSKSHAVNYPVLIVASMYAYTVVMHVAWPAADVSCMYMDRGRDYACMCVVEYYMYMV